MPIDHPLVRYTDPGLIRDRVVEAFSRLNRAAHANDEHAERLRSASAT